MAGEHANNRDTSPVVNNGSISVLLSRVIVSRVAASRVAGWRTVPATTVVNVSAQIRADQDRAACQLQRARVAGDVSRPSPPPGVRDVNVGRYIRTAHNAPAPSARTGSLAEGIRAADHLPRRQGRHRPPSLLPSARVGRRHRNPRYAAFSLRSLALPSSADEPVIFPGVCVSLVPSLRSLSLLGVVIIIEVCVLLMPVISVFNSFL